MAINRRVFLLSAISLSIFTAFPKYARAACGSEPSTVDFNLKNAIAATAIAVGLVLAVSVFAPAGATAAATVGAAVTAEKVATVMLGLGIAAFGATLTDFSFKSYIGEVTQNLRDSIEGINSH